jgi:hypothetical protein
MILGGMSGVDSVLRKRGGNMRDQQAMIAHVSALPKRIHYSFEYDVTSKTRQITTATTPATTNART